MPFLLSLLLLSLHFTTSISARKTPEKILLSNVKTLTLRKDLQSTHNRVSPIPQVRPHLPFPLPFPHLPSQTLPPPPPFHPIRNTNPQLTSPPPANLPRPRLHPPPTLHPPLQEPRRRLQRRRHPMDLHRLPPPRIQARLHGCHLRGLRIGRRPVRAEGELWRGLSAAVDGGGGGEVWAAGWGRGVWWW